MPLPPGPCLNFDLVELILNSNDHWWPCDLVNISLISAIWLEPVRRRLYATPGLTTFRGCSHLARTLKEVPSLSSLVKGVELSPISAGGDGVAGDEARASVRSILSLNGLKSITIGGELAHCSSRFLLAISDTEAVEELHIDGRILESSGRGYIASLEWDESFSFRFSNLKTLRLTSLELEIMAPSFEAFNTSIQELSLDDVTISTGFLSDIFDKASSLRKLSFRTQCQTDTNVFVRDVLSCCNLEELEYEVVTESSSEFSLLSEDTTDLSPLRSLRLLGVNVHRDTLHIIGQKCQALEELLVVGRGVTISSEEWVSFIESCVLPQLRQLGVPWGTKHPPYTKWLPSTADNLRNATSKHNIRLLDKHRVCG